MTVTNSNPTPKPPRSKLELALVVLVVLTAVVMLIPRFLPRGSSNGLGADGVPAEPIPDDHKTPPREAPPVRMVQFIPMTNTNAPSLAEKWGIEVTSATFSMGNSIIDLRYRVLDPAKVKLLADGKTAAYIVDESSGVKLPAPSPPREGAFPPSSNKLIAGRSYFTLVQNPGGVIRPGSKVTLVVGNCVTNHLVLE